ncbi:Fatty acid desaturase [Enhygromyxa salina]|uniref:Fatty acid desaturase n=1 Tax=Enhygromyxa salina TaxID=215803 RepID=A0A2S9YHZ5_9BACT|nr:fatty acid desaturase [Enhygromyxa salina]PRQ04735.1 Fatty acid desaturase [Enhygromyxa salina]
MEPPSYGWETKPSARQLFRELLTRINVFADRKNWLALTNWVWTLALIPFLLLFFFKYFTWWMLPLGFLYSMVAMGTYGTIWLHRYGTHRAFVFSHPVWRFITRNLVIKIVPEEIYIVSHMVHHAKPEQPGDPYNAKAGGLYCFLADVTSQPIARDLSPEDYERVVKLVAHTGVVANSYEQYQRWGSIAHPLRTTLHFGLNWAFWYGAFYLIGGHLLAVTMFGSAHIWAIGIRTFNFAGHGGGKDKRRDGVDFNRRDLSINQYWPGFVAGEWHNNHHLYASSARAGFLWYQIDLAWYYIKFLSMIGAVSSYQDHRARFLKQHWEPYLARKRADLERSVDAVEHAES